jgi:hypothetical protein
MGLLGDSFKAMRMKDPVDATAQVVGGTAPPDSASSGNVRLNLVVQPEGMEAVSVEHSCIAPVKKWPFPGSTLPVTVDRADPDRLKIRWDEMPDHGEVSAQQADALAAQLNQGGEAGQGRVVMGGDVSDLVQQLQQAYPEAQVEVQGGDASALGHGGEGAAAPDADGDDRVGQLERLAKLRDAGALTDAEFEREKARILGG